MDGIEWPFTFNFSNEDYCFWHLFNLSSVNAMCKFYACNLISQETELYRHCQFHSTLWCMPNWSNWSEGNSQYIICCFMLYFLFQLSISPIILVILITVIHCVYMFRKLCSMHRRPAMSTSKNIDDTMPRYRVPNWYEQALLD